MNAIADRWIGRCRRELSGRTLIWNQNHLRQVLRQYQTHHNEHRPHRTLDAALVRAGARFERGQLVEREEPAA